MNISIISLAFCYTKFEMAAFLVFIDFLTNAAMSLAISKKDSSFFS